MTKYTDGAKISGYVWRI